MAAERFSGGARSAATFWGIAVLFLILLVVVRVAAQPLLLVFAAVLFGTSLRGLAEWLAAKVRWRVGVALAVVILTLLAVTVISWIVIVPGLVDQFDKLTQTLTTAYEYARTRLQHSALGQRVFGASSAVSQPMQYVGHAAGILATAVGLIGSALFVTFVTIYFASAPEAYRRGVLKLLPPPQRARGANVLDAIARVLRRWMLGRIVSMFAVGLVTWIGLAVLGIPLAFPLALLAGVLGFVPNIGPIVSAVPALLIATTLGLPEVVYVGILYVAINLADGYLLTPMIEKRSVATPPAIILVGQVVFGAVWGILGLTLATPLLACVIVLVHKLYVEDVLEDG
jgi:predicted PurR-regulated permease PerM